jgi:hypothetical protein
MSQQEERILLRAVDGSELVGILRAVRPAGGPPRELMLMCHGMFGHKNNFFFPKLAEALPCAS